MFTKIKFLFYHNFLTFSLAFFSHNLVETTNFNYNGKPGEKTLRSLDQISLQDGIVRGRNSYTDSYGNPVAYDSLDDVDARKPSSNKDNPNQYVIPGYASGILQPHEIPSRNSNNEDEGRRINDDKIHFVDPLHPNSFQPFNTPSTSLTVPGINNINAETPINIPRPNIDKNETPVDPTNLPLGPPLQSNDQNSPPSTFLEAPVDQNRNSNPFLAGLTPPQIPNIDGVEIPRPNLNAHETPIDDSQNALNQGLLPPTSAQPNFNTFSNTDQNGPVVITDEQTVFAPKPVNGLLPPKDPLPADFQASPSQNNVASTSSKFAGNFEGTIGGGVTTAAPIQIPVQVIQDPNDRRVNKFTGTITTGAPIHIPVQVIQDPNNRKVNNFVGGNTTPTPVQIPVQVVHDPNDRGVNKFTGTITTGTPIHIPVQVIQDPNQPKRNKYTGSFGGSQGVLVSDNLADRIVPTQGPKIQPTVSSAINNVLPTRGTLNKFTGSFGGSLGVLSSNNIQSNPTPNIQFATNAPSTQGNNFSFTSNKKAQLSFGGPEGVLRPFDNLQKN